MTDPGFSGHWCVRPINGGKWVMEGELVFSTEDGNSYVVPQGVITDFASCRIGRFSLLSWGAAFSPAAILHDYLYQTGCVTRSRADLLFKEALERLNITGYDLFKAYWGVRLFGGLAYRAHAKARARRRGQHPNSG